MYNSLISHWPLKLLAQHKFRQFPTSIEKAHSLASTTKAVLRISMNIEWNKFICFFASATKLLCVHCYNNANALQLSSLESADWIEELSLFNYQWKHNNESFRTFSIEFRNFNLGKIALQAQPKYLHFSAILPVLKVLALLGLIKL